MPWQPEAKAAKLTQHRRAICFARGSFGPRVTVHVPNISSPLISPAARIIHQARAIQRLQPVGQALGVVLPPALVEEHPHDNGWMISTAFDHSLQFDLKLSAAWRRSIIATGHVLPNEQTQFIAPVIPA